MLCQTVTCLAAGGTTEWIDLTGHRFGIFSIITFVTAYTAVITEEFTQLRKSKPVLLAAGPIWIMITSIYEQQDIPHAVAAAARNNILEYAELFLFLLVAITYINSMDERQVFEALRLWQVRFGFSCRKLFWVAGLFSFFISPVADNLTTALLMCAVVMAEGCDSRHFVAITCVNIISGKIMGIHV